MTRDSTSNMNITNNRTEANRLNTKPNSRTVENKLNIKPNRPNFMTNILRNINLFMTNTFRRVTNNGMSLRITNKDNSSISNSVLFQACLVSSYFYHVIRLSQACHHCIRSFTLFVTNSNVT